MQLAPNCTWANKCLIPNPVICHINMALLGKDQLEVSPEGRMLCPGLSIRTPACCLHGTSQANEAGCLMYLIWYNFALFSFLACYYLHLCVDSFPLLFLLGFYNRNKVFFPFWNQNMAVVNLLFRKEERLFFPSLSQSLALSLHMLTGKVVSGLSKKVDVCKPERELSPETKPCQTSLWDF